MKICPDDRYLRDLVNDIKEGKAEEAIFSLRLVFADDIEVLELIENEWRKQ